VLRNRLSPRWGSRIALGIEPLEVEQWLKALNREDDLANPTLDRMRRVMSLVYRHGQRYCLIPRSQESKPMRFVRCKTTSGYEAMIITPEQAYVIVRDLREPERTLTLLAAGTGLRISGDLFRNGPSSALNRGPASTDIASNSDKPTSQHSLDEKRVYSVLL